MSGDQFHFSLPISVRFRDLDAFGHVNNAVFFTYMEMSRTGYFERLGLLRGDFPAVFFIIAEATCQFKAPIRMQTRLIVKTRVSSIGNSSFVMEYQLVDQTTDQVMAIGRTVNVMYDYSASRSVPLPDDWRATIAAFEKF